MRILQVASEAYPLVKTGGLADVVGALGDALLRRGHDVRVLLPAYRGLFDATVADTSAPAIDLGDPLGAGAARLVPVRITPAGTPGWLLDCPALFDRPGGPYLDVNGLDHVDNDLRFALLARAGATLAAFGDAIGWAPQIVHAHDWQAGLVPAYLHAFGGRHPPCVFTVHNLHFGGRFDPAALPGLGLPWAMYSIDGLEFYGEASMLKAGLYYADRISTVSRTYAREIKTIAYGGGLHGLLQARAGVLHGVINGIDEREWDPEHDPRLPSPYTADDLAGKTTAGEALRARFGLASGGVAIGMVSRLTDQKGVDLLVDAWPFLAEHDARLVVLGTGEPMLEAAVRDLAELEPHRVGFHRGYDEALSHLVIAGADLLCVPSRFEPCGLTQMYAMRYGTVPVVRHTGGLADTVTDADIHPDTGTGIVFFPPMADALLDALERGLALCTEPERLQEVQRRGMTAAWGWDAAAKAYEAVYEAALAG